MAGPPVTTPLPCTDCKIVAAGAAGSLAGTYTPVVCCSGSDYSSEAKIRSPKDVYLERKNQA